MKKLKIIIPLLIVIIIAAVVAFVAIKGDQLGISNKSRVSMGISKTMNALQVSEDIVDDMSSYKFEQSMGSNPFETEVQMSVEGNVKELAIDEDIEKVLQDILKELSNANITMKLGMDQKEKVATMNLNLEAKDIIGTISGDAIIKPDSIAMRSKELNEDYVIVNKEDVKDLEDFEEVFDTLNSIFDVDFSKEIITDDDIDYLADTYSKVFKDFITDDMMKSEKAEYDVNGSKKSCKKEILTLENDDIKALLKKYIETYKNDKKGKEIIENIISSVYSKDLKEDLIEQIDDALDEIETAIDDIENAKIEFITYCSLTEVYGTELIMTVDGESVSFKFTFDGDETKMVVGSEDEEVFTATIKNTDDELSIVGKSEDGIEFEINVTAQKMSVIASVSSFGSKLGSVEFTCNFDTKKDEVKNFEQDSIIKFAIDIPNYVEADLTFNINEKISLVKSIDVDNTDDAIGVMDSEIEEYAEKCEKNLEKYVEKFQKSELYEIIESMSYPYGGSSSLYVDDDYDYNDDDWTWDYDDEDEEDDDYTFNSKSKSKSNSYNSFWDDEEDQ